MNSSKIPGGKLTNLQQELLRLYAQQVSERDLQNIRTLIGQYFADRLTTLADKAWIERCWSDQTMRDWLNNPERRDAHSISCLSGSSPSLP